MMEDSKAEEESMPTEQLDINTRLKYKDYALKNINNEDKNKIRQKLAEDISNVDDGNELNVIFKIFLVDDDILLSIYSSIYSSLLEGLAKIGPYTIEPFESVANGLSLTKNDISFHIYCSTSKDDPNISNKIVKVLNRSKHFSSVVPITQYRRIKCLHLDSGKTLHIDISEPYDLHNSEFVNQLKQGDNRINELMLFLKIWFKNVHIYTHEYLTKYCVLTLVIFYLQNSNPPVLTSIKTIQETAQKNIMKGINFGLNSRCIPMNPTQNIHQMIKGFFEFYSSLDFEKVIIAPYLGKVINKADFRNKVFQYPEYEAQMRMLTTTSGDPAKELETDGPLCVQDMFYLNRNIAKTNITKDFDELNFEYLKKCITMAHKKCCVPNISAKNLYKSLLVDIIDDLEVEFDIEAFEIIPMDNELKSLAKFVDQPLNLRKLWIKAYIAAIPQIISAIYKIDMILLPPKENCQFKNFDETEEPPLPFKWSISSSVDLWTGRDLKRSNATFMEYQLEQTKKLYAERRAKLEFAVEFNGFITITITKNLKSLHIEMSSNETRYKKNNLRKFFGSFKWYMRNYNLRHRIHLLERQLHQHSS